MNRFLFVGNSITKHEPVPDKGWYGSWGMAASVEEKDYVHILMNRISSHNNKAIFMYKNIAEYERSFWEYDLEKLKELRDFGADLIIMRIAENVDNNKSLEMNFSNYYTELINYLNKIRKAMIISTSSFWSGANVDLQIKRSCEENKFTFVNMGYLSDDESNMAKKYFQHEGVSMHPSDHGMERIADTIWRSIDKYVCSKT
jgi:hypothetical protein